jgi:hypothetical protein
MVERSRTPAIGRVALLTRVVEVAGDMIGIRRLIKIGLMTLEAA